MFACESLDSVFIAFKYWQISLYIGFVLEEIKIAPDSGHCVVDSSQYPAFRGNKLTATEKGELYMKHYDSGCFRFELYFGY